MCHEHFSMFKCDLAKPLLLTIIIKLLFNLRSVKFVQYETVHTFLGSQHIDRHFASLAARQRNKISI